MLRSELSLNSLTKAEGRYIESVTRRRLITRANPAVIAARGYRDPLTGQQVALTPTGTLRTQYLGNADGAQGAILPAAVRTAGQGFSDQKPIN